MLGQFHVLGPDTSPQSSETLAMNTSNCIVPCGLRDAFRLAARRLALPLSPDRQHRLIKARNILRVLTLVVTTCLRAKLRLGKFSNERLSTLGTTKHKTCRHSSPDATGSPLETIIKCSCVESSVIIHFGQFSCRLVVATGALVVTLVMLGGSGVPVVYNIACNTPDGYK